MKTTKYYLQNECGVDLGSYAAIIPLMCAITETTLFFVYIAQWPEPINLYEFIGQIVLYLFVGLTFILFNYMVFIELTNKPYIEIKSK